FTNYGDSDCHFHSHVDRRSDGHCDDDGYSDFNRTGYHIDGDPDDDGRPSNGDGHRDIDCQPNDDSHQHGHFDKRLGSDYDSDRDASGDDHDPDQHSAPDNADRHGHEHNDFAAPVDPDGDGDRHHNCLRRHEQRGERALPVVRPLSGWA